MARARFIRPEFFTDSTTGRWSLEARLLYVACWTQADIQGVLEWDLAQLRSAAFPYDHFTEEKVTGAMQELIKSKRVVTFRANNKRYGYIRKWLEHQSFTSGEKKNGPRFPAPPLSDSGQTMVRPWSDKSQTPAPSLSPSPSHTPSPSPEGSDTAASDGGEAACAQRVKAVEGRVICPFIRKNQPKRLLEAFGCNMARGAEWDRECHNIQIGVLGAILLWKLQYKDPIREPSGLRMAREEWAGLEHEAKAELAKEIQHVANHGIFSWEQPF